MEGLSKQRKSLDFIEQCVRVQGASEYVLVTINPKSLQFATYDNALMALYFLRLDRVREAERILVTLSQLQNADGSLPFSGSLNSVASSSHYIRLGAMAWVGYAAALFLNDTKWGHHRDEISAMTQKIAAYILAHQVTAGKDPRKGLFLGGEGTFLLHKELGKIVEHFVPGPIEWISSEHNFDIYFFLRAWSRTTGDKHLNDVAGVLGKTIIESLWDNASGQFVQGMSKLSRDGSTALDGASWGSLFLWEFGERDLAEKAFVTAEKNYRSHARGSTGHRPYRSKPIFEDQSVANTFSLAPLQNSWDALPAIWPEGSAGLALAAYRLGHKDRAKDLVENLEKLRLTDGGLPDLTEKVPYEFSGESSLAGTLWLELVNLERAKDVKQGWLWHITIP